MEADVSLIKTLSLSKPSVLKVDTPKSPAFSSIMEVLYFHVFSFTFLTLLASSAFANVVLIGNNVTVSFDDIQANFAPVVEGSGVCGVLHLAEPLDACSPLTNKVATAQMENIGYYSFVLIVRGGCSFEDKVRRAQSAGFKAAIIYDNDDDGALVAMAGNSAGIKIHAVFISKASGQVLTKYTGLADLELCIIPSFEDMAWSIQPIIFFSMLTITVLFVTVARIHHCYRMRQERTQASRVREFRGMSSRLVKALPSLIFTSVLEDNCTSVTCAICLEDYGVGEKLRILPCLHKFHASCVDSWLTSWRTFCPICKRDARTSMVGPPASEFTPLLSSNPSSVAPSSALSSLASSPAIQIARAMPRSPSASHIHYLSSAPYFPQSQSSYRQSTALNVNPSSFDLRNASSQRSYASYLASQHSSGFRSISPSTTTYIPSPSNASSSYVGSSSQLPHPLHCSESATNFSPFASAQSLPGC